MTDPHADVSAPDMWVRNGAAELAVTVQGAGTPILTLHAGVCDRRSWQWCAARWGEVGLRTIAFDRRGFGQTRYEAESYDSLGDVRAVSAATAARPAVVVGASMGGALALDLALAYPDDVLALVLVGSLPSGAPGEAWVQSPEEAEAEAALEAAEQARDLDLVNRLEVHYWLDGPAQPHGRVMGAPRDLMLAMNHRALTASPPGDEASRPEAWSRLAEVQAPTLLVVGEHDETGVALLAEMASARVPDARIRYLPDTAHCPMLDRPDELSAVVVEFLDEAGIIGSG